MRTYMRTYSTYTEVIDELNKIDMPLAAVELELTVVAAHPSPSLIDMADRAADDDLRYRRMRGFGDIWIVVDDVIWDWFDSGWRRLAF